MPQTQLSQLSSWKLERTFKQTKHTQKVWEKDLY